MCVCVCVCVCCVSFLFCCFSAPVSLDQAGFMPVRRATAAAAVMTWRQLRREFEVEYHNDAEEAISPVRVSRRAASTTAVTTTAVAAAVGV